MKRGLMIGALVGVATLIAVAINPGPGQSGAGTSAFELLDDVEFVLPVRASPWIGKFRSVEVTDVPGRTVARIESGAIAQNVDFGATDRSYRFTARLRSAGAKGTTARGVLRAQTRCDAPEATSTAFEVGDTWQVVSATLDPQRPEGCSLGVGIEASAGSAVLVRRAGLVDANLVNSSFEAGQSPPRGAPNPGWKIANDAPFTKFTLENDAAALDGRSVGWLRVTGGNGSVAQDIVLDASSEQIRATATISLKTAPAPAQVRGGSAAPATTATVALWTVCDEPENVFREVKLTSAWQSATVTLEPKQHLRRVDKPPCTIRVEVYSNDAGAGVYLDAAHVVLETAAKDEKTAPQGGSPSSSAAT